MATFYGRMIDHDYTQKEVFNKNFFKDWRKVMTDREREIIRDTAHLECLCSMFHLFTSASGQSCCVFLARGFCTK